LSDARLELLKQWLTKELGDVEYAIEVASADASFRRYFRITIDGETMIVMDAPPEHESVDKFIKTAKMFARIGVNVPLIKAEDVDQGFLLITDLGIREYQDELNNKTVDRLYGDALAALLTIQASGTEVDIPEYDMPLLMREMEIFREWYLEKHLAYPLTDELNNKITKAFEFLASSALEQPRVVVHRDYHSRNLLITDQHNPGIIDFQDTVIGPVTYDLVSLLRDCYIDWPKEQVLQWVHGFHENCTQSGIIKGVDEATFVRWFDLMGVQRHLKASGIFARLNYRDGKSGYLPDIPRTLGYVGDVASRYPELSDLASLLDSIDINQHKLKETI